MTKPEDKLKIAICTHAFRFVDFDVYFNHQWCIANWATKHDLKFIGKKGLDAATARNQIIDRAIEEGCTHAFFMDADHLFPLQALDILLENKDEAMTSGLVCKKGEQFQQVGWVIDKNRYKGVNLPIDGRVYEVGACAFGCTLINLKTLQKLKKPYFGDIYVAETQANIRSDINLALMFRDIGEKVWIDTRLLIGHLGMESTVYPQNSELFEKLKALEFDNRKLREGQPGVYYVYQ